MLCDACKHVTQVSLGIDTVQFGRADQAVNRGGSFAPGIGTRKEVIPAADRNPGLILPMAN